jgi:NTP pyrophosphatase (non-canonical NTP hydrolase)
MTFDDYQNEMRRTYKPGRPAGHALGLAGEAGEVADLVKKDLYHSVPYTRSDIKKEIGDVLWYLAAVAEDNGLSLAECAAGNVEKLRARYPDGFVPGGGVR